MIKKLPQVTIISKENGLCEDNFIKTHQQLESVRYVIRLPFKKIPLVSNNSYELALWHLVQVERSLQKIQLLIHSTGSSCTNIFIKDTRNLYHHIRNNQQFTYHIIIHYDHLASQPNFELFLMALVINNYKSLNEMLYRDQKLQRNMVTVYAYAHPPLNWPVPSPN